MNNSGKIKNNWHTRLTRGQQRKIAKTIKNARNILMLPISGYIKPTDRKSLTTLQEDLEDYTRRKINVETGQIYYDKTNPNAKSENPYHPEDVSEFQQNQYDTIKDLEFDFLPIMPNSEEVKILQAKKYSQILKRDELKKRGVSIDKLKTERNDAMGKNYYDPKQDEDKFLENEGNKAELEKAYNDFQKVYASIPAGRIAEAIIAEKAVAGDRIRQVTQRSNSVVNKSREELEVELQKLKKNLGI